MKKYTLFILSVIYLMLTPVCYAEEQITFGILTGTSVVTASEAKAALIPFENYMKNKLKLNVKISIVSNIEDLINGMKTGKYQWGYASNLEYIKAKKELNVVPVAKLFKGNSDMYHALLLVRKDSDIETLEDLKGKTISYSSKYSSHGYLYPNMLLKTNFNENIESFFTDNVKTNKDIDSIYAVYYKKAAVAGAADVTYKTMCELMPKMKRDIRVIATSEPMLYVSVFYYDRNINDKENIERIKQVLFDMDKIVEGKQTLMALKVSAWIPMTDSEYNPMRRLLSKLEK